MSLRIICGVPRSGKSYYAVHHLRTTYFDKDLNLKPEFTGLQIVTNIEGLMLPHVPLRTWLEGYNNKPELLFSIDNQEKIFAKYPKVIYLIDEVQNFFPSTFRGDKVGNWLQYHGHYGQDIYFMTQDITLIPRSFVVLAEDIVRALPRTSIVFSSRSCQYNRITQKGDILSKFAIPKKKEIFNLYKSQSATETEKTRSPMTKMLVMSGIFFVLVTGYSGLKMWGVFQPAEKKNNVSLPPPSSASASMAPSIPPVVHPVAKFVETYVASQPVENLLVAPGVSWVGVDYIRTFEKFLILFHDLIFTADTFPYPVQWHGRRLSALIPVADLAGLPPSSSPFTPPPVVPASLGREPSASPSSPLAGLFPGKGGSVSDP